MKELNAYQAATLADDVYSFTKLNTLQDAMNFIKHKYRGAFTLSNDDVLLGATGGPGFIKCRTAFGFTLIGHGVYKNQALILFRGTQYLADWLTNLNVSVSSSLTGQSVHDGFAKTFKSMAPHLMRFMASKDMKGISTVHCVGHSLGGALATICGDWVKNAYGTNPYIYSFGSPRVGLHSFADYCTSHVGSKRIFRAYHKTDIVPCIPTWPFSHTPVSGEDYYLPSPGLLPMAEYHGMDHYIASVRKKSWETLSGLKDIAKNEPGIMQWLKEKGAVGVTMSALEWLGESLKWVLKKCGEGYLWLQTRNFSSNFTFMDQLAYILSKGISLAGSVSEWVLHLIKKIMQMLGMVANIKVEDLTVKFMREVLMNMQHRINSFTKEALSKVMVEGRAI
ncbi:MAG: lipase family protein [Gammaproteobacteria bacterium]|nr:lipase family protein [Gammaproteobacteria bacterium]